MDNAVAEYVFVTTFFKPEGEASTLSSPREHFPTGLLSPNFDQHSNIGSDYGGTVVANSVANETRNNHRTVTKAEQANLDATWKQILDPVIEYCQVTCLHSFYPISFSCCNSRPLSGLFSILPLKSFHS
jgi:hypothetical protein